MNEDLFGGPALFLDRSDINTDEIIPARYLTTVTKDALQPHLLEDLELPGFTRDDTTFREARVIVTRRNFGCGSSREHAPWALEVNGIRTVVAESFARIFRQNMFNGGMLAVELPAGDIDRLFAMAGQGAVTIRADLDQGTIVARCAGEGLTFPFDLDPFALALVRSGGWVNFADERY
jgi:3-isopropylmalate/(R)-2-methylmalate dehydratase small subunit